HGDEDRVERLAHRLELVDVQRLHRDHEIADGAREPESLRLHRLDVLGPLVDERDVAPRLGEAAPPHRSDRPPPENADALDHDDLLLTALPGLTDAATVCRNAERCKRRCLEIPTLDARATAGFHDPGGFMGVFSVSMDVGGLDGARFERVDAWVDTGAFY